MFMHQPLLTVDAFTDHISMNHLLKRNQPWTSPQKKGMEISKENCLLLKEQGSKFNGKDFNEGKSECLRPLLRWNIF